jgi:hypothetical protein
VGDKPFAGFNRLGGMLGGNLGIRTGFIIVDRFEGVGPRQERSPFSIHTRVILGETKKFRRHTVMSLEHLFRALGDNSLGNMKGRKIGIPTGGLVESNASHDLRIAQ